MVQNTMNLKTYLYKDSWKIAGLIDCYSKLLEQIC
jgi:hypothetical protein